MFTAIIFVVLLFFVVSVDADCPDGAIPWKSNCYLFNSMEEGFVKAEMSCTKSGGHLVSIHDAFTNDVIGQNAPDFFYNISISDYWIGANSLTTPNTWEWTDESTFDFTDWQKGEPSNDSDLQCASASMTNGYWTANDCFNLKPFVCTILAGTPAPPTTPPPMTTSVPVITEQPTTTSSGPQGNCTTGWIYFNHAYYCHLPSMEVKWQDGENFCFNIGGHLPSIHSNEENHFLTDLMIADRFTIWTGLYSQDKWFWFWSDGTPTDYFLWYTGEPFSGNGNCVILGNNAFQSALSDFDQDDCADTWHVVC